ncbi:MAG: glycosyl transferase 2 family protein [Herbaspirillum sp.]|nr:glycosyl transferase 2 family protein [Herbaspirillum sp.]
MTKYSLTSGVALCTFNGIAYLSDQLESLLAQKRLPDRIVIFDDESDDGTWEFLQEWAHRAPLSVLVHRNSRRMGIVRNFEAAVSALDTELIFLCDQDDIWLPEKIDELARMFESDSDVLLINTDAKLVDQDARDLKISLFEALRLSEDERNRMHNGDAFSVLCRRNLVTGATVAFRRSLLDLALPFPDNWLHDEWLAITAAAKGKIVLMDGLLIQYRQHGRNAVGIQIPGFLQCIKLFWRLMCFLPGEFQEKHAGRFNVLFERLSARHMLSPANLAVMQSALAHSRVRSSLPKNPVQRFYAVLNEVRTGRYRKFSRGVRGIVRDIMNR